MQKSQASLRTAEALPSRLWCQEAGRAPSSHQATFTLNSTFYANGLPSPAPPSPSQRALGLSPLWQAVYKQNVMWAPVFISEQCVKREQQNVKFKSRCAVSNVGVIWRGPGDWSLFRGDLGYALVLGGGVRCSSPASPWSCLSLVLPLYLTWACVIWARRRLGSAPLQLKQWQWVIGLCSSSSFLPCPYSVEFIFSDFKQKESLCL